jgi:hypothetical protein
MNDEFEELSDQLSEVRLRNREDSDVNMKGFELMSVYSSSLRAYKVDFSLNRDQIEDLELEYDPFSFPV